MPSTMPTLLITASTVVRQRSDICIPRMLANARQSMISARQDQDRFGEDDPLEVLLAAPASWKIS